MCIYSRHLLITNKPPWLAFPAGTSGITFYPCAPEEYIYISGNKRAIGVALIPLGCFLGVRVCDPASPYGWHAEAEGAPPFWFLICILADSFVFLFMFVTWAKYVCVHVYIHIYTCIYTHICIYIYIYIYIHTGMPFRAESGPAGGRGTSRAQSEPDCASGRWVLPERCRGKSNLVLPLAAQEKHPTSTRSARLELCPKSM